MPGSALNLPTEGPIPTAGLFAGGLSSARQTLSGEFLELLAPLLGVLGGAPVEQNARAAGVAASAQPARSARADSEEKKPEKKESDSNYQPAMPAACFVPPTPPILLNPLAFPLGATASTAPGAVQDSPSESVSAAAASPSPGLPDKSPSAPAIDLSSPGPQLAGTSAQSPDPKREQQAEFLATSASGNTGSGANPANGAAGDSGAPERRQAGLAFAARLVPAEDNQEQPQPSPVEQSSAAKSPADGAAPRLPQVGAAEIAGPRPRSELPQLPARAVTETSSPAPDGVSEGSSEAMVETGPPRVTPAATWASVEEPPTGAPAQPVLSRTTMGSPAAGDSTSGGPVASQVESEPSPPTGSESKAAAPAQTRSQEGNRAPSVDSAEDHGVASSPALPDSPGVVKWAGIADSRNPRELFQTAADEVSSQAMPEGEGQAVAETRQPRSIPASYSSAGASAPAQPGLSQMALGNPAAGKPSRGGPIAPEGKGDETPPTGSEIQAAPDEMRDQAENQAENRAQPAGRQAESGDTTRLTTADAANPSVPPGAAPVLPGPSDPASVPRTAAEAGPAERAAATVAETAPLAERTMAVKFAPASEISLSLGGGNQDGVQVRVVDRAGEVHVTVRTPDGELARDLRQDLSQLVTRLEQKGYQAETWRPSGQTETLSQPRQQPRDPSGENLSGNPGGAEQQGGGRRGPSQQQKQRPQWLQEMEQTFGEGQ